jgi:hypothetical protein
MAHMYIHHITTTIRSSFYMSSILLGRLAAPDPSRPLQYLSPLQINNKQRNKGMNHAFILGPIGLVANI